MDYTNNYHLPQWVKSDRIMMEDFNDAMARLETGLTNAQSTASAAQSAASSARSAASSAQSTANKALSQLPYAAGSYTGNGSSLTITVGFKPSFVIINGGKPGAATRETYFGVYGIMSSVSYDTIAFTSTGFTVNSKTTPALCDDGRKYEYIAFK